MAVGWPFGLIKLGVTLQHWTAHDTAVPDAAIYCFSVCTYHVVLDNSRNPLCICRYALGMEQASPLRR